jgi:hypothetical protein
MEEGRSNGRARTFDAAVTVTEDETLDDESE